MYLGEILQQESFDPFELGKNVILMLGRLLADLLQETLLLEDVHTVIVLTRLVGVEQRIEVRLMDRLTVLQRFDEILQLLLALFDDDVVIGQLTAEQNVPEVVDGVSVHVDIAHRLQRDEKRVDVMARHVTGLNGRRGRLPIGHAVVQYVARDELAEGVLGQVDILVVDGCVKEQVGEEGKVRLKIDRKFLHRDVENVFDEMTRGTVKEIDLRFSGVVLDRWDVQLIVEGHRWMLDGGALSQGLLIVQLGLLKFAGELGSTERTEQFQALSNTLLLLF